MVIILFSLLICSSNIWAQPLPCNPNSGNWVVDSTNATFKVCNSLGDTWINVGVPSGTIVVSLTSCGIGYTEATELNGKTLVGTLAANKDVGNTGGSDNITPTGSNSSLTFTGNSVASNLVSGGTPSGTNGASATSGNCAATNIAAGTGSTTACKATAPNLTVTAQVFSGSALATHQHTTTATGSINTPSFTGNSFDNRSAFVKVIFCKKS